MYIRGHHISADDRRGEGSEPKYHHGVRGGLSVGWQSRNMMVKAWYACFRPVIPLFRWANLASADIWMTPNLSDTLWGWCIVLHPFPPHSLLENYVYLWAFKKIFIRILNHKSKVSLIHFCYSMYSCSKKSFHDVLNTIYISYAYLCFILWICKLRRRVYSEANKI